VPTAEMIRLLDLLANEVDRADWPLVKKDEAYAYIEDFRELLT
jgi:hypothetical protein